MRAAAPCIGLLLLASAALATALPQPQQPADAPAQTPNKAETGPELFVSSGCSHCHQIDGAGGHKGPDLSGIGRRWKDDVIRRQIEHGALEMPAYADVLSAAEINQLVTYLHTRRAKEAKHPPAKVPAPVLTPDPA